MSSQRQSAPPSGAASGRDALALADVQSRADGRNLAINQVGIRRLRYPVVVQDRGAAQSTVACFSMSVGLAADVRGTHMSRFIDLLGGDRCWTMASFAEWLTRMCDRLDARSGRIEMTFPYFISKTAPVSGIASLLDYQTSFIGEIGPDAHPSILKIVIPVTSLCPCSKAISDYGAHNQRAHVTLEAAPANDRAVLSIEALVAMVESQASAQLYGLLKRSDEKFLTEQAYDNPKFVEDLVRDVAQCCNRDERIGAYTVTVENFESIHNHSAFAQIARPMPPR